MVSFRSQPEELEGAQAAGAVPAKFTAGAGVAGVPGTGQDADDQVVHGCQQARRGAGADPAGVLAVSCVTPVVQAVLDAPVVTVMAEQARRAGLAGGQADDPGHGLARHLRAQLPGAGEQCLLGALAAGAAGADVAHRRGARVPVTLDEEHLLRAGPAGPDGLGGGGGPDDAHVVAAVTGLVSDVLRGGKDSQPKEQICSSRAGWLPLAMSV